jgi:CRP-like cAMP-binding protein
MGNRLLATLPASDLDLLRPELEMIALDQDAIISRAGDAIEYVFFPYSGAISLMIDMADGQTVAIAAVGREGAVGILSVLGPSSADNTAVVRAAGTAARIPAISPLSAVLRYGTRSRLNRGDAEAASARFGLQRASPGRSAHGALVAPASRPRRP